VYLAGASRDRVKDPLERLKRKHGFDTGGGDDDDARPARQLLLFE
jgi:hypothetical protein